MNHSAILRNHIELMKALYSDTVCSDRAYEELSLELSTSSCIRYGCPLALFYLIPSYMS